MSRFYTNVFQKGNNIYLRGYEMGLRVHKKIPYKPYLFTPSKNKDEEYKTIDEKPVGKVNFDSISDAKEFLKTYKDISGVDIYGLDNFVYTYIYDNYPGEINYDVSLIKINTLDIEVASDKGFPSIEKAEKEITAITIRSNGFSMIFGCGNYVNKDSKIQYIKCDNEEDLILKFLDVWESETWCPDIITGWYTNFFDIPYLINRISKILNTNHAKRLSPWKMIEEKKIIINNRENLTYTIFGISQLDYQEIYKKFSFGNQESYRLDHICNVELGERKLDYSEYESLLDLYKKDYQKFIDYNNRDCILVDKLEEKLGFLKQIMALAYDAKVNYNDTLTTVRPWDVIIHNYLMDKNIVIPQLKKSHSENQIMGGFVKEPIPGMYKWVVSLDLTSLYPHLIMQYNISPDTFLKKIENNFPSIDGLLERKLKIDNNTPYSYTANGCVFKKDKVGFLTALMEKMYSDRKTYKNKMLEAKKRLELIEEELAKRT